MKIKLIAGFIFFTTVLTSGLHAADVPLEFSNPAQELRFNDLTEELRCLVCQNQSLADSNSDLAQDLRMEVYRMLMEGDSNENIIKYLVDRYGDFVLYRPPLKPTTYLLWFSPILFLIIGVWVAVSLIRKKQIRLLNEEEQKYADQLLNKDLSGDNK